MSQAIVSSSRQHVDFVDYLKGLLILLVTFGHAIQFIIYAGRGDAFFSDPVFQAIYMFHMPFFMMISGYVLYRGQNPSFSSQWRKRARSLLPPTVVWAVIYALIEGFLKKLSARDMITLIPQKISVLWYLPCLFLCWLVFAAGQKILQGKNLRLRLGFFAILSVAILFLPETNILPYFKFTFPFYCLGHFLAEQQAWCSRLLRWRRAMVLLATAVFALCFLLWTPEVYLYISGSMPDAANLSHIALRYIAALAGFVLFAALAVFLHDKIKAPIIYEMGRASIYIYILQIFFYKLYAHFGQAHNFILLYALAPFGAFALAYIALKIGKGLHARVPFLSLWLFGR